MLCVFVVCIDVVGLDVLLLDRFTFRYASSRLLLFLCALLLNRFLSESLVFSYAGARLLACFLARACSPTQRRTKHSAEPRTFLLAPPLLVSNVINT